MKGADLSLYQLGALTHFELVKKAKTVPTFAGFFDPKIFFMSFGWFQTKKNRNYSEQDCIKFRAGFTAAENLRQDDNHDRHGQCVKNPCPICDQNW